MKSIFLLKSSGIYLFFLLGAGLLFGSCEFNVSTAKVSDVKICDNLDGSLCSSDNTELSSSVFSVYSSCLLKNATTDTKVKFTWIYYGETKFEIDNVILSTGDKIGNVELNSSLSRPTNGWPTGVYEVVIQVQTDNAEPIVKQFNIN